MGGKKTRDGLRLTKIIKAAKQVGIKVREGTNHMYNMNYGSLRPCPIATSTDAKKMLVPWLREATGYENNTIYSALRSGKWR